MSEWLSYPTSSFEMASTSFNQVPIQHDTGISGLTHNSFHSKDFNGEITKHAGRAGTHGAALIQTSLYVIVAMVILVCALIHLFIYRRRRKAKRKKHTYENTKPTKSGRCFHVEPRLFEKKSSKATPRIIEPAFPIYKEPMKPLCYSIVDITDAVSSWEHMDSSHDTGKSEPDLRRSCHYYESIQIDPQDTKKSVTLSAKTKATEATTKLKKFGAEKKTKLQRTFQSLTNLCVTNLDSCEDLTKTKVTSKVDYSRLRSPPAKMDRSVGNIYDTLSRQNPWNVTERRTGKYDDIEVRIASEVSAWAKSGRKHYQSPSLVAKAAPQTSSDGHYTPGKIPKWQLERFERPIKNADYEHIHMNRPKLDSARGHVSHVTPDNFTPVYFTLDPALKQAQRTPISFL